MEGGCASYKRRLSFYLPFVMFLLELQAPEKLSLCEYRHNWEGSMQRARELAESYGYPVDIRDVREDVAYVTIEPETE
jgi:hypothetical protein